MMCKDLEMERTTIELLEAKNARMRRALGVIAEGSFIDLRALADEWELTAKFTNRGWQSDLITAIARAALGGEA